MLWLKWLHICFMVTWFAGLFYLPRLFVYHAMSSDDASLERFKVMERKLFWGIMTPGAVLTIVFGTWLWLGYGIGRGPASQGNGWMHAKLAVVVLVIGYHHACGVLLRKLADGSSRRGHVWFRWFNEVPVLLLLVAVVLVVVKPF